MSDTTTECFDPDDASEFNARKAQPMGWYRNLPPQAVAEWPGLAADALGGWQAQVLFASEVRAYQMDRHLQADGKLGAGTYGDMLERYTPARPSGEYFMVRGQMVGVESRSPPYRLITFDEAQALELYSGDDYNGYLDMPDRRFRRIVLHWGGHDAPGCRNALFNNGVSSHFGVDADTAHQWLDLGNRAWHASWANEDSIGIDICQQPTIGNLDRYLAMGRNVEVIDNPAVRESGQVVGERQVLTLDAVTADTVRELCRDLCDTFGIPFEVPRFADGSPSHEQISQAEFDDYEGILCHSHVSTSGKWDVAPWMGQLFG